MDKESRPDIFDKNESEPTDTSKKAKTKKSKKAKDSKAKNKDIQNKFAAFDADEVDSGNDKLEGKVETQKVEAEDQNNAQPDSSLIEDEPYLSEQLDLTGKVEAVIFASPKPLKPSDILEIIQTDDERHSIKEVEGVLNSLVRLFNERSGGFKLEFLKGVGYQFRTVEAAKDLMAKMFASRPRPLSRAALETLSIIAYRQPCTRADVEFVRGVDSGSIIKNLMDRDLTTCVGRKEDAGRPMLFGTTEEFLKVFRLSSLDELPPLTAFQPAKEVMDQASKGVDQEESVDVDEFLDDPEREVQPVSEGIKDDGLEVAGDGEPSEELSEKRIGASVKDDRGEVDPGSISFALPEDVEKDEEHVSQLAENNDNSKDSEESSDIVVESGAENGMDQPLIASELDDVESSSSLEGVKIEEGSEPQGLTEDSSLVDSSSDLEGFGDNSGDSESPSNSDNPFWELDVIEQDIQEKEKDN